MLRIVQLVIALGLLGASITLPARAEDAATKESFYVLIYSQGPAWKPGVAMAKQPVGKHYAYMQSLRDTHRLFLAGPLDDINGGLIVVRAESLDDAKSVMARDPAIIAGVFVGEVHGWDAALASGRTAADFLAAPE